jgi:hypothetical protein
VTHSPFWLRRPAGDEVGRLLDSQSRLPVTYDEDVGGGESATGPGSRLARGIDQNLDSFASKVDAESWKSFARDNPDDWKNTLTDLMNQESTTAHFNLQDVDVWQGVTRAAAGRGGATDWELLQFRSNPDWLSRTTFYNGQDAVLPNPFG